MSELHDAISEMRNMRESYDQIGAAAEAYNTGKVQLAQNISSKGVPASANETLPELAEKVSAIAQESYVIQGGEMYAKQLFGSLETPNYWNLYDVLAQLLSDGRLVDYGGILLAEYYRSYDSLALSGAGTGGAYVVSDLDENGQFKMYTEDTTHIWATEFDGKGNRWVAYCFADEYHDFQITDTNTSPRSIFIGRKVGTIKQYVDSRTSQIIVPDGNVLREYDANGFSTAWGQQMVLRNIENQTKNVTFTPNLSTGIPNLEKVYFDCDTLSGCLLYCNDRGTFPVINTIVARIKHFANIEGCGLIGDTRNINTLSTIVIDGTMDGDVILGMNISSGYTTNLPSSVKQIAIINCNADRIVYGPINSSFASDFKLYLGYGNGQSPLSFYYRNTNPFAYMLDIELQSGWNKSLDVSKFISLTEENMYAHILQHLKQDEPDCGDGVTITLGSTNLAKLTSDESVQLLDDLTNIYGYTFA
ncbi:MAG: hypothetical protein UHX00_05170 [Caryophanon sp.]|nr:hypothetical protein [Caryophanon sp.]